MRRPILSLMAICGLTTFGLADDFNPFAQEVSIEETVAPITPQPEPVAPVESVPPAPTLEGETHLEEWNTESHGGHEGHHESHEGHSEDHFAHEYHGHHAHHGHEHEEKVGNIRVTPLYREIESDLWDMVFDSMYSVNIGTTFWQPEHHYCNFSTQVGLVTEFQYSALDAKSGTNISSVVSVPFNQRENLRVDDADIYAGNIGLSFAVNTYLPDSHTKLELGFSPLLTIGNLSTDLIPNTPAANDTTIVLGRRASDNGTIVGGDFRLWTGIKTESGFRAGLTGFYGVAETDAIFDSSQTFNTYGGGFYVEIPACCVPHEFPAPMGTFQWFEELFGLE